MQQRERSKNWRTTKLIDMKKLLILFLFFNCAVAYSQNLHFAIDSLQKELRQKTKPADRIVIMDTLSDFYGYIGETDSVRILGDQMLKLATDTREDSLLAYAYIELGYYFSLTGDYKQALQFDFKAKALGERSNSRYTSYLSNKEIGAFFKELKNYPEALKYLDRSRLFLNTATSTDDNSANRIYSHIAETFLGLGQVDSALRYIQLTNEVTSKEKDAYGFARMLYIFASVYKARGDTDLAESYYKKCIAFSEAGNISLPYVTASIGYGQYLFDTRQYDRSKQFALAGFHKAKEAKNKTGIINAAALLRKVFYAIGQKDSSFYYSDIKDIYSDSVYNEQQRNQIQNLTFAQQIREQEDQSRLLQEAEERNQNIQFALIAVGIISFIIIYLLLSRSLITNTRVIEFLSVVALLIVFEFLNLLLHPFLERVTSHSPILMLLALVSIAALLVPLHHRIELWATHKIVEKNKAIRLAAAKKTIEKLEGEA